MNTVAVGSNFIGYLAVTSQSRPINDVVSLIGDKWTVLVISLLGDGSMRFSELKNAIGAISQKMLTMTLRSLERYSYVMRTEFPTIFDGWFLPHIRLLGLSGIIFR